MSSNLACQNTPSPRGNDWGHIRLSYVVPVYINKPNAEDVLAIFKRYASYKKEILDRVLFVVADDGSPVKYDFPKLGLNLIYLKIDEDISWNNPGARNLGVVFAKSDKVFISDIDHELDEKTFEIFLKMPSPQKDLWRIPRFTVKGEKLRLPHANTFLLSRGHFLKHFGYDEAFCGHYAGDDVFLAKYLKTYGGRIRTLHNGARATKVEYPAKDGETFTHTLVRDKTYNKSIFLAKMASMRKFGRYADGHSREFLNFPFHVERIDRREVPAPEKKDGFWAYTWWARWLWGKV
jgi:hypothetical protein